MDSPMDKIHEGRAHPVVWSTVRRLRLTAGPRVRCAAGWLRARRPSRDAVEIVVIDLHAGYAAAIREALPHARIAVDHFHLIMLAKTAHTAMRQRDTRICSVDAAAPPTRPGPTGDCCCAAANAAGLEPWPACRTADPTGHPDRPDCREKTPSLYAPTPRPAGAAMRFTPGCGPSTTGAPPPTSPN